MNNTARVPSRISYRGASYRLVRVAKEAPDNPEVELATEKRVRPSFRELDATVENTKYIEDVANTVVVSAKKLNSMLSNLRVQLVKLLDHNIDPTSDTLDILDEGKRLEYETTVSDMSGANRMLNYTVDVAVHTFKMAINQIDALAEDYSASLRTNIQDRDPKELPEVVHVWSSDPTAI